MTDWVRACRLDDLPADEPRGFTLAGTAICLARTCGAVFAVRDQCTHEEVPLSEGEVDDCAVECWMHGSRFDLRTGQPSGPPATSPVPVYRVSVEGEGDDAVVLVDTAARPL